MFIATQPTTADPLQSRAAQASTPASTSSSPNDANSMSTTFITLLVQELQNQDPTAPMDSTQMVGQMISLNQLDQLSGIHQILSSAYGTSGSSTGTATGSATGSIQTPHQATLPTAAASVASPTSPTSLNDGLIAR